MIIYIWPYYKKNYNKEDRDYQCLTYFITFKRIVPLNSGNEQNHYLFDGKTQFDAHKANISWKQNTMMKRMHQKAHLQSLQTNL